MSIDLSALLAPISEQSPCGEELSFSNEFHEIKKAKTEDDFLLDQGDWVTERKQADWEFVASKSKALLENQTKDIRLLTWLTEAWSHLYGFEGIQKGLSLSHQLLEQYWLIIHPEIEDDDLDQRIGLLQGMINQLPQLVKKVPLINSQPFYNLLDYENILYHENIRRKQTDENASSDSPSGLEQFDQTLFNTSKSFQFQNYQSFTEVLNEWSKLKDVLDALMGIDSPSFASIDSALANTHSTLRKIYKAESFGNLNTSAESSDVNMPIVDTHLENLNAQNAHGVAMSFQPNSQNHLANREQAMHLLQEIADYFQANEPHSPVSYLLQKTIKWSQMPLHEWLAQVIKDDQPLQMVQEMLGVPPKNEYE